MWQTLTATKKMIPEKLDFDFSASLPNVLANYVGFLVLHPWTPETEKELTGLHEREELESNKAVYTLITNFLSKEIVTTKLDQYSLDEFEMYSAPYKNHQVLIV